MKRVLVAIGLLAALGARPGWAQSADECMPSALNIPGAKYPCGGARPGGVQRRGQTALPRDRGGGRPGTKNFSGALMKADVHNVYFESPDTAHEWLTWRRAAPRPERLRPEAIQVTDGGMGAAEATRRESCEFPPLPRCN